MGSVRSLASVYPRRCIDQAFLGDAHDVERNLNGLDKTGAAEGSGGHSGCDDGGDEGDFGVHRARDRSGSWRQSS
jgi:hypothetical protein